jgi:hypothetical protein
VALLPTLTVLLKQGTGVKDVHVGTNAAKMSIATSSVWADETDISSVTGTSDWKAAMDKLSKPTSPYRVITEVFQITPDRCLVVADWRLDWPHCRASRCVTSVRRIIG